VHQEISVLQCAMNQKSLRTTVLDCTVWLKLGLLSFPVLTVTSLLLLHVCPVFPAIKYYYVMSLLNHALFPCLQSPSKHDPSTWPAHLPSLGTALGFLHIQFSCWFISCVTSNCKTPRLPIQMFRLTKSKLYEWPSKISCSLLKNAPPQLFSTSTR
jgi:hypothetical protein